MNSPITGIKMNLENEMMEVTYKGKIIPYMHTSYFCKDSKEYFTTTEIDDVNLQRIKDKYKIIYG